MSRQLFKQTTVELGDIKLGSKGNKVFWEFDDLKKEEIATYEDNKGKTLYAVKGTCGCTVAGVTDEGIEGEYNSGGNKLEPIHKVVKVYLKPDDDTPIRVKNDRGVMDFNPDLAKVLLSFNGELVK